MRKSILKFTSIFLIAVIFTSCGPYDQAVLLQEEVDESWGNVGAAYQRRADLVPQLVATVKGAAENEKEIPYNNHRRLGPTL